MIAIFVRGLVKPYPGLVGMLDGCTRVIVLLLEEVLEEMVAAAVEVAAVPVPVPVVVEGKREGVVMWGMKLCRS
jgi:hypothetical protein